MRVLLLAILLLMGQGLGFNEAWSVEYSKLTWDLSTDNVGVAGYNIYRAPTACSGTTPAVKIARAPATARAYADTIDPPAGSTKLCYRITAIDAAGNESDPTPPKEITIPIVLGVPQNFTVDMKTGLFTWDRVAGASRYLLFLHRAGSSYECGVMLCGRSLDTQYSATLVGGATYDAWVLGVTEDGREGPGRGIAFTTPPVTGPTIVAAEGHSAGKATTKGETGLPVPPLVDVIRGVQVNEGQLTFRYTQKVCPRGFSKTVTRPTPTSPERKITLTCLK